MPVDDGRICRVLDHLRTGEATNAWAEFLQNYSPVILQVIRLLESDHDSIADCYLFVGEQLSRNRFRRLCKFEPNGKASFSTWLRVVVRNLCLDWRRHEFGRHRVFESVKNLATLDQQVFQCLFRRGLSVSETFLTLRPAYPHLQEEQVEAIQGRLDSLLTPRQRWLLKTERPEFMRESAASDSEGIGLDEQLPDTRPDPETWASQQQEQASLAKALNKLPAADRLLIRLRYEQGLTLGKVAELTGLMDAQTADRRIRSILEILRAELAG
jgi:RNA polymerase sigma factor (sigma-70 family)